MRRHAATLAAAALLLSSIVGPVAAGSPTAGSATAVASADAPNPAGRWIVLYRNGTDAARATATRSLRIGFKADRTYSHGIRGFSAVLGDGQVATLRRDADVAMVVPDERIEVEAQGYPTGISRIGARTSPAARIDGVDQRVDADVAIVDTGIARVPELNVIGGHDCSTSNPARWRDVYGHGTHVAGTVGAIDNGSGVVGVAPGVRLWAVKVIDDSGSGLLSWYVCGIDWITAQRDPDDPSRPRIEAVNMSITKWGSDDGACGSLNSDALHVAICRLVGSGVTVVAAAANDSGPASLRVPASYNEVITVSALADTDGKPGGLGGHRCFSWGGYDTDDTFADFSNYGPDVDLIAPGKCITSTMPNGGLAYMSGTSMAAPHVTGAVALLKASRPYFTPAEVKEALKALGSLDWRTSTDPDEVHEKLLDVARIGPRGDFSVSAVNVPEVPTSGGTAEVTIRLTRSATSFERVYFRAVRLIPGVRASFGRDSLYGFTDLATKMLVRVSPGLAPGTYQIGVAGDEHGRVHDAPVTFTVVGDPVPPPPTTDQAPSGLVDPAPPTLHIVTAGSVGIRSPVRVRTPDGRTQTPEAHGSPSTTGVVGTASVEPAAERPTPPRTPTTEHSTAGAPSTGLEAQPAPHRFRIRYAFVIAC